MAITEQFDLQAERRRADVERLATFGTIVTFTPKATGVEAFIVVIDVPVARLDVDPNYAVFWTSDQVSPIPVKGDEIQVTLGGRYIIFEVRRDGATGLNLICSRA